MGTKSLRIAQLSLGARHIKDGTLRLQFNREVAYYARSIVNDVEQGKKSPEQGLNDLKNEQNSLLSQSLEVAQKGVGAIAGALQFAAGAGICYGSAGMLCLFAGAPLMAYGSVDLGLSAYGVGRLILKPDAWRLFRYVRTDYVRGYENSSKAALTFEVVSDTATVNSMYLEAKSRDK